MKILQSHNRYQISGGEDIVVVSVQKLLAVHQEQPYAAVRARSSMETLFGDQYIVHHGRNPAIDRCQVVSVKAHCGRAIH